jgi:uncharacterized protein (TIGR02757 family)
LIATKTKRSLAEFLDAKTAEYNRPAFIASDPISIPHMFGKRQDIEIAGFLAAIFSWGNRTTIIRKSRELMQLMDNSPHQFIMGHQGSDLKRMLDFKHRTFNATDLLYFIAFFRHHYTHHDSLEDAFLRTDLTLRPVVPIKSRPGTTSSSSASRSSVPAAPRPHAALPAAPGLAAFYPYFFSLEDAPPRTRKHIASPEKNSSCKRLNMFLRWMVRQDDQGVDFGIWKRISPSALICPLDVHVARVARRFGLLTRTTTDWQAALELTDHLRTFDRSDPVKYDFALFGLGVMEKF